MTDPSFRTATDGTVGGGGRVRASASRKGKRTKHEPPWIKAKDVPEVCPWVARFAICACVGLARIHEVLSFCS